MRSLLVAALLAAPHLASADDFRQLQRAVRGSDPAPLVAMMAEQVQVEIPVETSVCGKLTGTVGRDKLAPCLLALGGMGGLYANDGIGSKDPIISGTDGISVTVKFRAGKITAIGPVAVSGADAKLPTTVGHIYVTFHPSKPLATALDKLSGGVTSIHKVCFDERGAITSRRVVEKSTSPAFEKEVGAWVAVLKPNDRSLKPFGTAIAFCDLLRMDYPEGVEGGEVGGEVGGVEGGVVGGDINGVAGAPPPPPPPPPPAPPRNVPPTLLEAFRISGEKAIAPDDRTKIDMARANKEKLIAAFKLCLATTGDISLVTLLKSSGFPAYDAKLDAGIRTWKYRPYAVDGRAVPVCTAVTFIYSQSPPPPPAPAP